MLVLLIGELNKDINLAIDIAKQQGAKLVSFQELDKSLEFIMNSQVDIILIDVKYDIKTLVSSLKREKIILPIVAYGIDASPSEAVLAIKQGAKEFITMPPDKDLISMILESISLNKSNIIGNSKEMKDIMKMIDKIAPSAANVFITGDSGTGKEVIARYIHAKSNRKDKNFVATNCAAIPENLIESELFGHEKGAFTGALSRRIGKFEQSSGGTLLLDEISEIDVSLQAKLLRAIQERQIDRIGGKNPVDVDLRIVATSNRSIENEIKKGNFREDLYFRLNIIHIKIPKLKDRKDDILPLTEFFINKYSKLNQIDINKLSDEAKELLLEYHWPGNVRELENTIHRSILLSQNGIIKKGDLCLNIQNEKFIADQDNIEEDSEDNNQDVKGHGDMEKKMIFNTLGYCIGDMSKAASILGISMSKLKEKIKEYTRNI